MVKCYNTGCGQEYDPEQNTEESCRHHPGVPFFHDAYKGWTCCNKKSIIFTEFLNMKGCYMSKHSNIKPPEPEKPAVVVKEEPVKMPEPLKTSSLKRPQFDTPLTTLEPTVAPGLQQAVDKILSDKAVKTESVVNSSEVAVGTICKNGGCGVAYASADTDSTVCVHHPGSPVFHEGLKYWSCCVKRTSDFQAFLEQKGCEDGKHKWIQIVQKEDSVKCRYDWHQTCNEVVVAIYAKLYNYKTSFVKISPVRLAVSLVFPQQNDAEFNLDMELRGIINVAKSRVQYFGTKVEIVMPKAEFCHWKLLDFPSQEAIEAQNELYKEKLLQAKVREEEIRVLADTESDSSLDLDDIVPMKNMKNVRIANDDDGDKEEEEAKITEVTDEEVPAN